MARLASSVYDLMESIKAAHEEAAPDLGASVFADLLSAAVSEINWYEIAQSLWDDENEDDDD